MTGPKPTTTTEHLPLATPKPRTEVDAVLSAALDLGHVGFRQIGDDAHPVLVASVPKGRELASVKRFLDEYRDAPERITGTATLHDEASFVAHVNEMKLPTTRTFCDRLAKPPQLVAVYDYHEVTEKTQKPAFGKHRARWPLTMSEEWDAWTEKNGKAMNMVEFSEFLEQHMPDVFWGDERSDYTNLLIEKLELRLASPSALINLARNLAVNVDTGVRNAVTLQTGEIALTYVETHRDHEGKPVTVPNAFLIAIPVVFGGPLYQVLARLRYRVQGPKIVWFFELHRIDLVLESALKEICERVADETERPVFLGTPEA